MDSLPSDSDDQHARTPEDARADPFDRGSDDDSDSRRKSIRVSPQSPVLLPPARRLIIATC